MSDPLHSYFIKGLTTHLVPFRLVLGLCPVLAVTQNIKNGIGMGLATTFVLISANAMVSIFKKFIPDSVRIPAYILIIATFVTTAEFFMKAYAYPLYKSLGIFIPLIVVNCIVLGRAEAFASKNSLPASIADGAGIGAGFTLSLCVIGAIREILGFGSFLGTPLFPDKAIPMAVIGDAPGAFITLGLLLCLMNIVSRKKPSTI